MNLNLPPDQQAFLNRLVETGQFASPEAVVSAGIQLLEETEELRAQIAVGIKEADAGNLLDHDEVFARLREKAIGV